MKHDSNFCCENNHCLSINLRSRSNNPVYGLGNQAHFIQKILISALESFSRKEPQAYYIELGGPPSSLSEALGGALPYADAYR